MLCKVCWLVDLETEDFQVEYEKVGEGSLNFLETDFADGLVKDGGL